MATYMIQASFTADAWANLCKHPEDRGAVVAEQMKTFGGKMLSYYYCFGAYDVVIITEAPNDAAMMAALAGGASVGHLKATMTTKLFTSRETMDAMAEAGKSVITPPSG
ncbi:MAG: GYD domain-containing protein [Alphaproteobacteria bacterium]|nr:GYD domain-containing protein [Alphaproteobacteria bacterium]